MQAKYEGRDLASENGTLWQIPMDPRPVGIPRPMSLVPVFLVVMISLVLAAGVVVGWAATTFDEAHIFFELNNTDGDLGIHALIDGEEWRKLEIRDPNKHRMLKIAVQGRLRMQGLTELFFESAEPTFDELSPEDFFSRFPAGDYEIKGTTLEGDKLASTAELTHVMPAPPGGITLNDALLGEIAKERCDEDSDEFDPKVVAVPSGTVTIVWDDVTMSHPNPLGGGAGIQPPIAVAIHNYQVVVEVEVEVNGEELNSVFSVVLPPDQTSMTVPAEFIALGEAFKFEILAREESFNQTAIESCFVLEE